MANEVRLIDANALYDKLCNMAKEPYYQHEDEDYYVGVAESACMVAESPTVDVITVDEIEELKFTRQFIHEHGLEFALASAWKGRTEDGK